MPTQQTDTIRLLPVGQPYNRGSDPDKDQRFKNCYVETVSNPFSQTKKQWLIKRPGFDEYINSVGITVQPPTGMGYPGSGSVSFGGSATTSYIDAGDPYWDNVILLMRMNNNLNEESGTLSVSGSSYSFSAGKFSEALQLGNSTVDTGANAALRVTGLFTLEFWLKQDSISAANIGYFMNLTSVPGTNFGNFHFIANAGGSGGQLVFSSSGPGVSLQVAMIPDTTNYHHIALVYDGTEYQGFLNGVKNATSATAGAQSFSADPLIHIGKSSYIGGGSLGIHIDELRITKGVARYTADFTPPTAPFPNE